MTVEDRLLQLYAAGLSVKKCAKETEKGVEIINKVVLIGNIASDPEHLITKSGKPVCTLRLAVQRRFTNAQGVREADFFTVVAWGKLADLAARYLAKGRKAAVTGWLQTRSYEAQDGTKRYVTEIVAEEIEFLSGGAKEQGGGAKEQGGGDTVSQARAAFGAEFVEVDDSELPF